ncbi:glycosyltransferase family 4 protein [Halofilum ochraceum]|uniref:glycosyltransferase family 4 protein n=1 Tax=Halofilum ochraceum TaxID=1611323 RepID=UPI000832068A|nr:glycosyltransferase family 4 protein [Halofilum ochraceum]
MTSRCVAFVANRGYALTSSRSGLIRRFLDAGWDVILVTADDAESRSLCASGARLEPVIFRRGGLAPVSDLRAFRRLLAIYCRWQPALIQHFHARPVIFGNVAARRVLGDSVRIVNTITGLGRTFAGGRLAARLAGWGYAAGMRRADAGIFQNRDDYRLFLERGWISDGRAWLIAGSGVDLERFVPVDRSHRSDTAPVVVMLARLLRQKGILEFATVAARIRERWPDAHFLLAGEEEPAHPDGLTAEWVKAQEHIEYLGRLADVRPVLAEADVFLFPSRYREGLPRVVLEAAATGLPAVAFDAPGVREAVLDGETGCLVSEGDVDALTGRVTALLEDGVRRRAMGRAARRMVEESFDVHAIEDQYLSIYRDLGIPI